jgi:hypothetical protein
MGRFPRPLVSGGLIAGRWLPPCPQLIAAHGLCGRQTPYQEHSPIPPAAVASDDAGNVRHDCSFTKIFCCLPMKLSTMPCNLSQRQTLPGAQGGG